MEKIAQKRGPLSKLREMTNISGARAEEFFSPQFKDVMENLRQVDDNVRSILSGQALDTGDPGPDPISAKKLLQDAKMFLNRREYMRAVTSLGEFHKHMGEVVEQLNKLDDKVNEVHHQFLFPEEDQEHRALLRNLKTRLESKKASRQLELRKVAGIMDFLHNVLNPRGKAMAFYEKRYPKQVGKLKKETAGLLGRAQNLSAQTITFLKEMASARATRNIDRYMSAAEKIKRNYETFHKLFQTFYDANVKPFENIFMKEQAKPGADGGEPSTQKVPGAAEELPFDLTQRKEEEEETPRTQVVVPSAPGSAPPSPVGPTMPATPLAPYGPPAEPYGAAPSYVPGAAPGGVVIPPPARMPTNLGPPVPQRDTIPSPPPEEMEERPATILPPMLAETHRKFLTSLEALSGESPLILASIIRKYAYEVQKKEPAVATKLLKIANSIRS